MSVLTGGGRRFWNRRLRAPLGAQAAIYGSVEPQVASGIAAFLGGFKFKFKSRRCSVDDRWYEVCSSRAGLIDREIMVSESSRYRREAEEDMAPRAAGRGGAAVPVCVADGGLTMEAFDREWARIEKEAEELAAKKA